MNEVLCPYCGTISNLVDKNIEAIVWIKSTNVNVKDKPLKFLCNCCSKTWVVKYE